MTIENLLFYDGYGKPLNLELDTENNVWKGSYYFKNIPIALFDTLNILMLEMYNDELRYPIMTTGTSGDDSFNYYWKEDQAAYFLYTVKNDPELKIPYIYPEDTITIDYDDLLTNARMPMQTNVAFNPYQEEPMERILYCDFNGVRVLELSFYGTGIYEDYRFSSWLVNFGVKFHVEDAYIIKDYDIKEAKPNWKLINEKRKEILVNKEQIFPYVGSYIGLINMIDVLGYRDILELKEYLVKRNVNSPQYNDYTLFSINELLERGVASVYNNKQLSLNRTTDDIKDMYTKTGFLALSYKFTVPSEDTDELGLPIVESTTEFDSDEIFYKLYRMKQFLEKDYLPTNVIIRDIIGEYIFFNNYILKNWKDDIDIRSYIYQQPLTVTVEQDIHRDIVDLNIFRRQEYTDGITWPRDTINETEYNFINRNQLWTPEENAALAAIIRTYYEQIKSDKIDTITSDLYWEAYSDNETPIGCPVIFNLGFEPLAALDYTNVITNELNDYYTAYNIEYRNVFEVEWRILKQDDKPYDFTIRGHIDDYKTLAHILPYQGTYNVEVKGYDLMGGYSNQWQMEITVVSDSEPAIYAIAKIPDKFTDKVSELTNSVVEDYSDSTGVNIYVSALNRADENPEFLNNYLNWYNFKKDLNKYEIFDPISGTFKFYQESTNEYKKWLGVYSDFTMDAFANDKINETRHIVMESYFFQDNYLTGWKFKEPVTTDEIFFNETILYTIPTYTDLQDLADQMNAEIHNIISMYYYSVKEPDELSDVYIHAQARDVNNQKLMFISYNGTINGDRFSFGRPKQFTDSYVEKLGEEFPDFYNMGTDAIDNSPLLMLDAPLPDILDGSAGTVQYWEDKRYIKVQSNENTILGNLPSNFYFDYFNLNKIKVWKNGFIFAKYIPVFFVINNLSGKNYFEWYIKDLEANAEIIRIKGVPFLMWTFIKESSYEVGVRIIDNKTNEYKQELKYYVQILRSNDYVDYVEKELSLRMKEINE